MIEDELRKLSTPQLKAIRQILVDGVEGVAGRKYANADGSKRLKALAAENEQLKKANARREAVENAGLEWNDPKYWLSLDDKTFEFVLAKFSKLQKEAMAEKTSMKIPPLFSEQELNALDTIREGLADLKRRNGNG